MGLIALALVTAFVIGGAIGSAVARVTRRATADEARRNCWHPPEGPDA